MRERKDADRTKNREIVRDLEREREREREREVDIEQMQRKIMRDC